MTSGAYPMWLALSPMCIAASGRLLMTSLDNGFSSQMSLSAATFALWSALATLFFRGTV